MTKSEVRAVSLSKLELAPGSVFWDIGAGTGSVAVEAARNFGYVGSIYAIERKTEGITLIQMNKEKLAPEFSQFHLVLGSAPEKLAELPAPSHVFIGGCGGKLKDILWVIFGKNPKARIVINAVTVETLAECMEAVSQYGFAYYEVVQVAVSRLEKMGSYHLQKAQNPVFVITVQKEKSDSVQIAGGRPWNGI